MLFAARALVEYGSVGNSNAMGYLQTWYCQVPWMRPVTIRSYGRPVGSSSRGQANGAGLPDGTNRATTRGMNDVVTALVRRHDPDRFLTALFAPAPRRDALMVLYAFNHELARARTVASETPLALIRLQWWREVVEGGARRHEVPPPVSRAIAAGALPAERLLPLIEAREAETYGD